MEDVFYSGPFAFRMGLKRGEPDAFFRYHSGDEFLINKRKEVLADFPEQCSVLLPEGEPLLEEFNSLLQAWEVIQAPVSNRCLGEKLAPDFLLLKADESGMPILVGGCVCFPSSWAFEKKIGRSLDWIHAVVPTLNETLGDKARSFLEKMPIGQAWLRTNWGLTATNDLNQHPSRNLPGLKAETDPETITFRIERQALIALPNTSGILFGIRLETFPLKDLKINPSARSGLLEALKTMAPEIASYKNLTAICPKLVRWLS